MNRIVSGELIEQATARAEYLLTGAPQGPHPDVTMTGLIGLNSFNRLVADTAIARIAGLDSASYIFGRTLDPVRDFWDGEPTITTGILWSEKGSKLASFGMHGLEVTAVQEDSGFEAGAVRKLMNAEPFNPENRVVVPMFGRERVARTPLQLLLARLTCSLIEEKPAVVRTTKAIGALASALAARLTPQ